MAVFWAATSSSLLALLSLHRRSIYSLSAAWVPHCLQQLCSVSLSLPSSILPSSISSVPSPRTQLQSFLSQVWWCAWHIYIHRHFPCSNIQRFVDSSYAVFQQLQVWFQFSLFVIMREKSKKLSRSFGMFQRKLSSIIIKSLFLIPKLSDVEARVYWLYFNFIQWSCFCDCVFVWLNIKVMGQALEQEKFVDCMAEIRSKHGVHFSRWGV